MEKKLVPWVRPPRSDQKFVPYIPQPRPDPNGYVPYVRQPKPDKEFVPWVRPPKSDQKFVPYISRAERARREREAAESAVLQDPAFVPYPGPADRPPYTPWPLLPIEPNNYNPHDLDYHRVEFDDVDNGNIIVYYYVPRSFFTPSPGVQGRDWFPRFVVAIHGAGEQHYQGARVNIADWQDFAESNGVIIIAPTFARWYGPKLGTPDGYTKPDWVAEGSQEDCAFIHEFCVAEQYTKKEIQEFLGEWDENLHEFTDLLNRSNYRHGDLALQCIVAALSRRFLGRVFHRFALVGYSGGGQFVNRYMMIHPEHLRTAAMGGAGTVMFPSEDLNYPFGMARRYDDWTAGAFTALGIEYPLVPGQPNWLFKGLNSFYHHSGDAWADWLPSVEAGEWDRKLALLLSLPVYIFAGSQDFDSKVDENGIYHPDWWTDRMWQGNGQMEKAGNLYRELLIADRALKNKPGATPGTHVRPHNAPFNVYLQPLLGAYHGHVDPLKDGRVLMKNWLVANWPTMPFRPKYDPFTCVYPTEAQ